MPHIKNALLRHRIIDRCLRNKHRPFPTKQDLREACEEALFGSVDGEHICDSTIEKDLFSMKMEHDAPIKYSRNDKGYYYSDKKFTLDDVPLNEEDLKAIKFAAYTLQQFREVDMFKQFGSAIDKIVDRVAISDKVNQEEMNEYVQFETAVSTGGGELLSQLLEAIQQSVAVFFDYENFGTGIVKPRKVCPLLLKEYRNRWYLVSQDLIKGKITTYGLDRMTNLSLSNEKILKPVGFNPKNYFKYSVGISTSEDSPEIVRFKALNIASKYIESQPFHHSQKVIKKGNNKTMFELEIFISEEFIRSLLSFGGEIEVVSPKSLRNNLVERLKLASMTYDF